MSEVSNTPLPLGWIKTTLSNLLTVIRGVSYKKPDAHSEFRDGLVPILRATNVGYMLDFESLVYVPNHYVKHQQFLRSGDIVVAASSGSRSIVGKAAQLKQEWIGSFGAFCFALRPLGGLDKGYIAWFLQTGEYRNRVSSLSAGININNLKRQHIEETSFPLPPLPEQHRIVAEIEKQFTRLDASVAALKRVRVNLKRYRASVLKAACEGELVPTEAELAQVEGRGYESAATLLDRILTERRARWESQEGRRGKYKEPAAPDASGLPELPEGWAWSTSAQVSMSMLGKMLDKKRVSGSPLPYLRNLNVRWDSFDLRDILTMPFVESEIDRYALLPGDVLIAEGGEPGRAAVWPGDEQPFKYQKALHRLRVFDGVLPKWLVFQLWASAQTGRLESYFTGSTIKHFTGESLGRYSLAVPPFAEQQRIVAEVERRLSVIQQAEDTVGASLKRAERLRQSILKQAFSGQLVPQNPNDEPASLLLERIRAERQTARAVMANGRKSRRPRSRPSPERQLLFSEETP